MVVALLALFVGLGGSAIAARGIITGAQIRDGSVTGADIANNALKGADILEPSLGQVPKAGNADLLDGINSDGFLRASGKASDADRVDGLDSSAFLPATAKAADADRVDGLDSSAFLPATGKAADANLLDGLDGSAFYTRTQADSRFGRRITNWYSQKLTNTFPVVATVPGLGEVYVSCFADANPVSVGWRNTTAVSQAAWFDGHAGTSSIFQSPVEPGGTNASSGAPGVTTRHVTIVAAGQGPTVAHIEVMATKNGSTPSGDCFGAAEVTY